MKLSAKIIGFLSQASPWTLVSIGFGMTAVLALIDGVTLPGLSFSIFYLIPVIFVTKSLGLRFGLFFCLLTASVWLMVTLFSQTFSHSFVPYWNAVVRLGYFVFIAMLIHFLEKTAEAMRSERDLSRRDPLTGVSNRRGLWEFASSALNRMRREKSFLTVALLDIDDFKSVNDLKGHAAGDDLLRQIAETLKQNIRNIDCVARMGGDEFALLMPGMDPLLAERNIRRIRESIKQSCELITVSIGAVTFVSPPKNMDDLFKEADVLMYSVKSGGKDAVSFAVWPVSQFGYSTKQFTQSASSN